MNDVKNAAVSDTMSAFEFYCAIRQRLPDEITVTTGSSVQYAPDLLSIADYFDVFVFDAFGVLNVGHTSIAGAPESINKLRALGKQVFVLTNGSSTRLPDIGEKFDRLGFDFRSDEIVSSRHAAEIALIRRSQLNPSIKLWGAITGGVSSPKDLPVDAIELAEAPDDYDRVDAIIFLSSSGWNTTSQKLLHNSLTRRQRPVIIANPDVVAPFESGFSLEPGYYAHRLLDELTLDIEFHGKPFSSVYDLIRQKLVGAVPERRIAMLGDTLHTDVLGAGTQGWTSILVSDHGLFRGYEIQPFIDAAGITPDWIIPTI